MSSGEQLGAGCGEPDIDAGLMPPQPSLGDHALDTCPVFVGTPASAQEWQVNQLDGDPLRAAIAAIQAFVHGRFAHVA